MTSQFIYVPPDPEINPDLNRNCILKVTFIEGKFFKDNDTFGKQDPFCQFEYDEELKKTKVIDDRGLQATWNQSFDLKNVFQ